MESLLAYFAIAIVFFGMAHSRAVSDESGERGYTCLYKGVQYQKGEELPTRGQCWHCVCEEGFVEPNAESCAPIDCPNPWEGICEPVYHETECCPVSYNCSTSFAPQASEAVDECKNCDWRYFKHYLVKGCKPVYKDEKCCPIKFECPDAPAEDRTACHYNGKTYSSGETIKGTNPCEICECHPSFAAPGTVEISCISIECPSVFGPDPRLLYGAGCYEVYEENSCCSTDVKCDKGDVSNATEPICELDGKIYHLGQKMYPNDDPCLICHCNENWNGIHGKSCRKHDCMFERDLRTLQDGCIPIYHESTCCPIEYHCPNGQEEVIPSEKSLTMASSGEAGDGNQCTFGGNKYNIGDILDIKHPTNCVTCTCKTPQDFTCIHKKCPPPPNNDYENCHSTYTPGECCPTYNCIQHAQARSALLCDPVQCPPGCSEISAPNSCPMCTCNDLLCSMPQCPPQCALSYEGTSCPSCNCPDTIPLNKPVCDPVKCGPQCYEAVSPQGCPMCVCGPLCSPPKCDPECQVETHVLEGQCPGCICPGEEPSAGLVPKVLCSPVRCPLDCRETTGHNGCPMCNCDPMCSPPKCDPGCRMETVPSSGPCPGCVCANIPKFIQCSPVKCGIGCSEVIIPNGCPMCSCSDILCSPPKCPEGCEIDTDISPGTCASCNCPPTIPSIECDPVRCADQCYEAISPLGCPMCICGPVCSPPKCDPGCHVQTQVAEGQCPGCECPSTGSVTGRGSQIQCAPVKCPSMCRQAVGRNGCDTCVCDPVCSPPKCGVGCRLQHASESSPCPECICDKSPEVPVIQCAPVSCPHGCIQALTESGCMTCVCEPMCSPPKCDSGCRLKLTTGPCPECACESSILPAMIQCSPPKCDPGCRIDFTLKPCPGCACDDKQVPFVACSMPKCDPGCRIDYSTGHCPKCTCDSIVPEIACTLPVCGIGCTIDYNMKPCAGCSCGSKEGDSPFVACSPPKCGPGCQIDYSMQPCPGCYCSPSLIDPMFACAPPQCGLGCSVDFSQRPCPGCTCGNSEVPSVLCSPPKCDPGCRIDYSTTPCPGCTCDNDKMIPDRILCSMPVCDKPGCRLDSSTEPCPSCVCDDDKLPSVLCSPPKCDPGCRVDYSTTPCPGCTCDNDKMIPDRILCSVPVCDKPGCRLDSSTEPCPSCVCDNDKSADLQCAPVRCGPMCREAINQYGCPTCLCGPQCSPPRCRPGCRVQRRGPCPTCVC